MLGPRSNTDSNTFQNEMQSIIIYSKDLHLDEGLDDFTPGSIIYLQSALKNVTMMTKMDIKICLKCHSFDYHSKNIAFSV